jgi:hypothetical protein
MGPRRLGRLLRHALDPAARRRGFAEAGVLAAWAAIVGPDLADRCRPIKLTFPRGRQSGVLHLQVGGAAALELQHCAPLVIERINIYFGYPAVAELRLLQAPLPPPAPPPAPRRGRGRAAEEIDAVARASEVITDMELREALARLGRTVKATSPPEPGSTG